LVSEIIDQGFIETLLKVEGLSVEVSPDSVFGGAALLFGSQLYVESVQGHISSLLHGGQCSMRTRRALVSGETLHRESRQEYMVVQSISGSTVSTDVPPRSVLFLEAVETVADILSDLGREEKRGPFCLSGCGPRTASRFLLIVRIGKFRLGITESMKSLRAKSVF
jgi:hypothetical protein